MSLVLRALAALNDAGVSHCLWKGSEHVGRSLIGESDLDVLVDRARLADADRILRGLEFRKPVWSRVSDSDIGDYFAFDPEVGALVHIQLYSRLVVGGGRSETFRIPRESEVLAGSSFPKVLGVSVAAPAHELAIRLISTAVGLRWRDRVLVSRGAGGSLQERLGAMRPAPLSEVVEVVGRWFGPDAAFAAGEILRRGPSHRRLTALRAELLRIGSAPSGRLHLAFRRWYREALSAARLINRRTFRRPWPLRRGMSGGLVVAIVGPDGSGKSTVSRDLARTLEAKFDVLHVYFGSGDGPSSLLRLPLRALKNTLTRAKSSSASIPSGRGKPVRLGRAVWALALAREKTRKLHLVAAAQRRGLFVVTDRYPQSQIPGVHDGPLLDDWLESPSRWRRRLARWERKPYLLAETLVPDLVIRLEADVEVVRSRRPHDHDLEQRVEAAGRLSFGSAPFGETMLNAADPYEAVLNRAQAAVWGCVT